MKYLPLLLTVCLIIGIGLYASDRPTIMLHDFSGGLNTKSGLFQLKPNEGGVCYNFDLGNTPGSLVKRKGFVKVWAGTDSTRHYDSVYTFVKDTTIDTTLTDSVAIHTHYYFCDEWYKGVCIGEWHPSTYSDDSVDVDTVTLSNYFTLIDTTITVTDTTLTIDTTYPPSNLMALYPQYYRDGRKELIGISRNGSAEGLGNLDGQLWRSGNKRYALDSLIYNYIYTGSYWSWVSSRNKVIMANGRQSPLVWTGNELRELVPQAPGEPRIYPVVTNRPFAVKWPSGEYRYLLWYWSPCGSSFGDDTATSSYLSRAIYANNEKICLTGFTSHTIDSTCKTSDGDWQDYTISIYRTRANPGVIDALDSFYYIGTKSGTSLAILDTLRVFDSLPDCSLGTGTHVLSEARFSVSKLGRDSAGVVTGIIMGAPTFVSKNPDTTGGINYPVSIPTFTVTSQFSDTSIIGVVYAMTLYDSILGIESDTGRNCYIFVDRDVNTGITRDSNFIIGLPPVPHGLTAYNRKLYKAYAMRTVVDTTQGHIRVGYDTTIVHRYDRKPDNYAGAFGYYQCGSYEDGSGTIRYYYCREFYDTVVTQLYANDTVLSKFYELALILDTSMKQYCDTTIWDTLIKGQVFWPHSRPFNLKNIIYFRDRLWGSIGSNVWYSYLDSVGYWSPFDMVSFNADDGDEITAIVPDREYLNVFKNHSSFVLSEDANGDMIKQWIESGRGCVAPFSVAWYGGNLLYLDETGLYSQQGSIYKDKGSTREAISAPIANLIDYPISELKEAVGFVNKDKYYLSFPDKDTTYVYDFLVGAWSIYNYAFQAAINYDTVSSIGLVPSSDMLFITGSDSAIYKADTGLTDNGRYIWAKWESVPLSISPDYSGVDQIALWHSGDGDRGRMFMYILDDKDTVRASKTVTMNGDLDKCDIFGIGTNLSNYFKIKLIPMQDSVSINGLDIWLSNKGKKITK
jgi:hypothetical protein